MLGDVFDTVDSEDQSNWAITGACQMARVLSNTQTGMKEDLQPKPVFTLSA